MPARDLYHQVVRRALQQDGWSITHDPYTLSVGGRNVFVDLGAERLLAASKGSDLIAVEIKAFSGPSELASLEQALGQYVLYRSLLRKIEPERRLVLAITQITYDTTFAEPIARPVLDELRLDLLTFDPGKERVVKWIHSTDTGN
ncbi:XisH family protein [bacterium]|nr:XisH family protein [bacterium]